MSVRTIMLGGTEYELPQRFTIGELVEMTPLVTGASARELGTVVDVVAMALKRPHPEITREALLNVPATLAELSAAFAAVIDIMGLAARKAE